MKRKMQFGNGENYGQRPGTIGENMSAVRLREAGVPSRCAERRVPS